MFSPLMSPILQKCQSGDDPKTKQKESFRHFVYYQKRFLFSGFTDLFDMEIITNDLV